jgi:stage II sporulation protein E
LTISFLYIFYASCREKRTVKIIQAFLSYDYRNIVDDRYLKRQNFRADFVKIITQLLQKRKVKVMDKSGREKSNAKEVVLTDGIRKIEGESAEKKKTVGDWASEIFFGLMYALWAYILGGFSLPFGAAPFGIALLCAAKERTLFIFAGLCLSAAGGAFPILRISVYTAVLLIRLLATLIFDTPWSEKEGREIGEKTFFEARSLFFNEHLGLRMSTACVGALAIGVYLLIKGGFLYYDLYGALISLATAPIAAALFAGLFGKRRDGSVYRTVGTIALAAVLVFATRNIEIYHVSAAAFGAMFASLHLVRREGTVTGVLAGAILGLCYSPSLAPLFAFGALCGGIVFPTSVTLGTLATFVVGAAWAIYTQGISALSGLLPAILASCIIYAAVDKLFISENKEETLVQNTEESKKAGVELLDSTAIDTLRLNDTEARIKAVCESFNSLSNIFESMGEMLRRPSEEDLRRICDNAFDSSCAGCSQKEVCWEQNYRRTDSEISALCAVLHRDGSVNMRDVNEALCTRCSRLPDILDEINHNACAYASRILQYDKTEIFANDYATVSDILAESMTRDGDDYEYDPELSKKLRDALAKLKTAEVNAVAVFGKRKKRIALHMESGLSFERRREDILRTVENIYGKRIVIEKEETLSDGTKSVILCEAKNLLVSVALRTVRADGEFEYCGDTAGVFYDNEDRFFAFISDGMGSGRDAAFASGICALFLKKMLSTGNGCEATVKMINGFLRNKGSGSLHECSATVDLWELDLLNGKAAFLKSGAAPTYVLREGGLFKIRSKTLPVGILREPDTKRISFDVGAGDVVVMVSDGVTQGKEECPWLFDLLRGNISTLGIEKTADLVVNYAKKEGSSDDLSVLILKIDKA